jgi:hypothetical protein
MLLPSRGPIAGSLFQPRAHCSRYRYFDDNREAAVVAIIEKAAKAADLEPSFVATIAAGERLGLWIDQHYAPAPPNVADAIMASTISVLITCAAAAPPP